MNAMVKHQCPYCKKMTNCDELYAHRENVFYDDPQDVVGEIAYYALRCKGCDGDGR